MTEEIVFPIHFVDHFPMAMLIADAKGIILRANTHLCTLFGYERGELEGNAVEVLLPPDKREQHVIYREHYTSEAPTARMLGTGRDLYGCHKGGNPVPLEVGLSPFKMGDKIYIIAVVIDISMRKKQESELRHLVRELEGSNRELSDFTSEIAHHMQAPLRRIEAFSALLVSEFQEKLPTEAQNYLSLITQATREGIEIFRPLLTLSPITLNK